MEFADFNLGHEDPMTADRMALIEALQKGDNGNFLRSLAEAVLQILTEADVRGMIDAGRSCGRGATSRLSSRPGRPQRRR